MNVNGYQGNFNQKSVAIPISTATSDAIDLGGFSLVGILIRALTGTTFTFTVCDTLGGTYIPLKSTTSGSALSYTVAANTYAAIDPKDFAGVRFLKIVSGSTEGTARTLVLSLKGL